MPTFDEFCTNEQLVYGKFRRVATEIVPQKGFKIDPVITNSIGALAIVVRHSEPAVQRAAEIGYSLNRIVSGLCVPDKNLHTTILTHPIPGLRYNPETHQSILGGMMRAVSQSLPKIPYSVRRKCSIAFDAPVYNQTTVILPGHASPEFFQIADDICRVCATTLDIEFRPFWGSHMTLLRFGEEVAPQSSKLRAFQDELASFAGIGSSHPTFIDVISAEIKGHKFDECTHARFCLSF